MSILVPRSWSSQRQGWTQIFAPPHPTKSCTLKGYQGVFTPCKEEYWNSPCSVISHHRDFRTSLVSFFWVTVLNIDRPQSWAWAPQDLWASSSYASWTHRRRYGLSWLPCHLHTLLRAVCASWCWGLLIGDQSIKRSWWSLAFVPSCKTYAGHREKAIGLSSRTFLFVWSWTTW